MLKPASVTKIYSVAAALEAFGPDHRFRTPIYRTGPVEQGILKGNLILVASGDPTLGGRADSPGKIAFKNTDHIYAGFMDAADVTETDPLAGLSSLARQVADSGIRRVDGDVIVDDRLFDHAEGTGSGPSKITPIVVNDNLVDVIVTPREAGKPASVRWIPQTAAIQVDAQVTTGPADGPTNVRVSEPSPGRIAVRGEVPAGRKPLVRIQEVDDPASFARSLLIEALHRSGVEVAASIHESNPAARLPGPEAIKRLTRVAELESAPFSEHAKLILKVSHNLHAGMLPLLMASKENRRTLNDGLRLSNRALRGLGITMTGVSFGSAAGGSPADIVSAAATVELLRKLADRPGFNVLHSALPVLGMDGTLAEAVPTSSPARGKVRAKTGTYVIHNPYADALLLTSKALAGYLEGRSGRKLAFAMFVNNVPPAPDDNGRPLAIRHGQTLGRLCEILYEAL
jgi:D-alanyl-D-alanine carboxypeptidase/D-alanyl-D-alanine-endopeptidase (penicillin-binding protein 4)